MVAELQEAKYQNKLQCQTLQKLNTNPALTKQCSSKNQYTARNQNRKVADRRNEEKQPVAYY